LLFPLWLEGALVEEIIVTERILGILFEVLLEDIEVAQVIIFIGACIDIVVKGIIALHVLQRVRQSFNKLLILTGGSFFVVLI
jgi:hypothetical protein